MSHGHPDKPHALAAMAGSGNICPVCGKRMSCGKWYPQPGKRFMAMAACEADGAFLVRVRLAEEPRWTLRANRLVYSSGQRGCRELPPPDRKADPPPPAQIGKSARQKGRCGVQSLNMIAIYKQTRSRVNLLIFYFLCK